jgi:large subunit ribosomal protein L24
MVKKSFSTTWKKSTQPRKQRKYRYNAPLHVKQKILHVHLSPELRKKYGFRNVQIKKGDKVKILKGKFAKKEGKVEKVSLKREKVFVTGIEVIKKEGTKLPAPLTHSNLMIIDLDLSDKKRKQKLESKNNTSKEKPKVEKEQPKKEIEKSTEESKVEEKK